MKIVAFGASNSTTSINKAFANYTAHLFEGAQIELLDLNNFPIPIYSPELESSSGIPERAILFAKKLASANLVILSLAEYNGSYTPAFKNMFDWCSRAEHKLFHKLKLFLLSTSPGAKGASCVMGAALREFPLHGAEILAAFSLPEYYQHFSTETGINHPVLKQEYVHQVEDVKNHFIVNQEQQKE